MQSQIYTTPKNFSYIFSFRINFRSSTINRRLATEVNIHFIEIGHFVFSRGTIYFEILTFARKSLGSKHIIIIYPVVYQNTAILLLLFIAILFTPKHFRFSQRNYFLRLKRAHKWMEKKRRRERERDERHENIGYKFKNKHIFSSSNVVKDRNDWTNETRCDTRASTLSPRRPRDTHAPRVAIAKGADKAHAGGTRHLYTGCSTFLRESGIFFGSYPDPRTRMVARRREGIIFFAIHMPWTDRQAYTRYTSPRRVPKENRKSK